MASTSSSSTHATTHYEYDLFLSFRGEDTRLSFTDHLYKALCEAGIRTFRDDDEIHEGQELKPEIERCIRSSRASIIVISEKFANSRWCLDELWLILQQRRDVGHLVFPVFYGVDPSDVRNQRGTFKIEAKEGTKWTTEDNVKRRKVAKEGTKWTEDNVNRWKAALTDVAELKGMVVSGSETAFIADIVQKIYCELDLKLVSIPSNLCGIENRAARINSWLKYVQPHCPVLAICGMGGSGKTTLAKHIYNTNKHNFESSSFLEDIEDQPGVLLGLQKQLLIDVLGNNITISNVSEGAFQIQKAIQRKKVLIVVDDIDDPDVLSILFGQNVFHTQSKIIITTRLLNIDTWVESISWRCKMYKLELLNPDESLELLSWHAFGSKSPMVGFEKIAVQLAQYCGGNPLALKVLGRSLCFGVENPLTTNNMIEIWRSRMNSLNSMKGDLDHKIQSVLQRSYESLACHNHKELFLHIACFFVGEWAKDVERILENDYHAKYGIMTLTNRCLVTVSTQNGKFVMHKLLQDMARNIVREESKDPAKRSRVWRYDESYRLLSNGDGSETIEGLRLNMRKAKQGRTSKTFKTSSLVKMKNLKLLKLYAVKLTGSYENFPDLRLLRWLKCNLRTIPSGLLMSSLVALDMRFGDLEKFEPPMVLNSLKFLNLSHSYKLVSICSLHRLPTLETLLLNSCTSLTYVCKTMGDLENLYVLYLSGCTRLWKPSSNQKCVNKLKRLKAFCICGGIPEQPLLALPQSFSTLALDFSPFEILPSYIDLQMLQILFLSFCPNLKSLPCLPSMLTHLYVDWCTSLERITFQSARFTLKRVSYEACFKLSEIEGLFKLVSISKLDEADLVNMQWVKAYQDHKVDLVGDQITEGKTFNIQMLYEYGIRSTYLQGIDDQSMATHEYTSLSNFLSFHVPLHPNKRRTQGLNVTVSYRSSGGEDRNTDHPSLFARISNITKGATWVYSPVVYCKPKVDEDVVWLSYWPVGNTLDAGDEVNVIIFLPKELKMVRGCGASLVFMDGGEIEKEEEKSDEVVIGGDLSRFKVTKGGYYLCRKNFYKSMIPACFFGDQILIADSRRWRTTGGHVVLSAYEEFNNFRNPRRRKYKVDVGVSFNSESEIAKIEKAVSGVEGVESVFADVEIGRLFVYGRFDHQAVVTCVKQFEKMVQILGRTIL